MAHKNRYPASDIQSITRRSTLLSALQRQSGQLARINHHFHELLDAQTAEHCQIVNAENGKIVILADSASWAFQVRFRSPEIAKFLQRRANLPSLPAIVLKTRPRPTLGPARNPPSKTTSYKINPALIEAGAASFSDPDLRAAVLRLAAKHKAGRR